MKPPLLKLAALFLILAGISSSCNPEESDYPIDISFTEYSLEGASCQWNNLNYDEKVIIINSNEELAKYITCTEGDYPAIDFTKHTLLLASGKTTGHIAEITANDLKQLSSNKYKLNVEATSCNLTHIEPWSMALVVEKLNKKGYVEINVTRKEIELELGLYKEINNWFDNYINFIDRENFAMISTGMTGGTFTNYFSYVIVKDSIKVTDSSGVIRSNFFHIIHSTKFEMHLYTPPIPNPLICIYEKP